MFSLQICTSHPPIPINIPTTASFQHPPLSINIPTTQCFLSTPSTSHQYTHYQCFLSTPTTSHQYSHYPVLPFNTHVFPSIFPLASATIPKCQHPPKLAAYHHCCYHTLLTCNRNPIDTTIMIVQYCTLFISHYFPTLPTILLQISIYGNKNLIGTCLFTSRTHFDL